MKWIDVNKELPKQEGIVWVRRQKWPNCPELAYYRDSEYHAEKFQDPLAVNDTEGLNCDYYDDVTHWMKLVVPKQTPF